MNAIQKRHLAVVVAFSLVLGGFIWWEIQRRYPTSSPEAAVETFFGCLDRMDADCFLPLISQAEIDADFNRDGFRKFVNEVLKPRMAGFKRVGDVKFADYGTQQGIASGTLRYEHSDGRWVEVQATGLATEDRCKVEPLAVMLVLAAAGDKEKLGKAIDSKRFAMRLRELQPELAACGMDPLWGNFGSTYGPSKMSVKDLAYRYDR